VTDRDVPLDAEREHEEQAEVLTAQEEHGERFAQERKLNHPDTPGELKLEEDV